MSTAVLHHLPVHGEPAHSWGPGSREGQREQSAEARPADSSLLLAARAQALFTSDLSAHCEYTQAEVVAAVRQAFRARDGIGGCAAEVAVAYGQYPETAARRMRWARAVIQGIDDFEAALYGGAGDAPGRPGENTCTPALAA
jgi:hypothetical protein